MKDPAERNLQQNIAAPAGYYRPLVEAPTPISFVKKVRTRPVTKGGKGKGSKDSYVYKDKYATNRRYRHPPVLMVVGKDRYSRLDRYGKNSMKSHKIMVRSAIAGREISVVVNVLSACSLIPPKLVCARKE